MNIFKTYSASLRTKTIFVKYSNKKLTINFHKYMIGEQAYELLL